MKKLLIPAIIMFANPVLAQSTNAPANVLLNQPIVLAPVPKPAEAPTAKAVAKAIERFNDVADHAYSEEQREHAASYMRALRDAAKAKLTKDSDTLDAIRAINRAEVESGLFEYVEDANLIQKPSKKIGLDCNQQSALYKVVLEGLAPEFPKIDPNKIQFKGTYNHAFLEYENGTGNQVIEVADPEKFIIFDKAGAPTAYQSAQTLTGDQIASNLLLDFSKDAIDKPAAIAVMEVAIHLDQRHLNAYNNLAGAYAEVGEFDKAEETINKAIEMAPTFEHLYLKRALIKIQASGLFGKSTKSEDVDSPLDNISSRPRDAESYAMFRLFNREPIENILKDLNTAIDLNPYFINGFLNRASFYAMIGKAREASRDLNRAKKLLDDAIKDIAKNGADALANPYKGSLLSFSSPTIKPNPQKLLNSYKEEVDAVRRLEPQISAARRLQLASSVDTNVAPLEKIENKVAKDSAPTNAPNLTTNALVSAAQFEEKLQGVACKLCDTELLFVDVPLKRLDGDLEKAQIAVTEEMKATTPIADLNKRQVHFVELPKPELLQIDPNLKPNEDAFYGKVEKRFEMVKFLILKDFEKRFDQSEKGASLRLIREPESFEARKILKQFKSEKQLFKMMEKMNHELLFERRYDKLHCPQN